MDPFEVALERKLEPLLAADAALRAQAGVVLARTSFRAYPAGAVLRLDRGRGLRGRW